MNLQFPLTLRRRAAYAGLLALTGSMLACTTMGTGTGMNIPQGAEQSKGGIAVPAALPGPVGYSQTNVQVVGVDEPDIVKNDARYIYTISGPTLAIIDAYPAAGAAVISKTELSDTPKDIFVNGDRLVLFTTGYGSPDYPVQPSGAEQAIGMIDETGQVAPENAERVGVHIGATWKSVKRTLSACSLSMAGVFSTGFPWQEKSP